MIQLMMPYRRRSSLHPVNSIKHVLDSEGQLATGGVSATALAVAVPNVDTTTFKVGDVRVGSTINAFFITVFVIGATGAPLNGSINWFLFKFHEGQGGSVPIPGQTGTSKIRNQIIHEEKGLAGSGDGTAMAFKGVIVVPKSMRRMREGDQWQINLNSLDATNNAQFCIKAIFKSFF